MAHPKTLNGQSALAGSIAAYGALLVIFSINLILMIQDGANANACSPNSKIPFGLCAALEIASAIFFIPVWSLFGLPFALVVALPVSLLVGRLMPPLERRFREESLRSLQYAMGATVGLTVMAVLAFLTVASDAYLANWSVGLIAGLIGCLVFRRLRYSKA